MSIRALSQAFDSLLGNSSLKSVVIALADRADDKTGLCFPSIADTIQRTELNRKTVIASMKFLRDRKIIVDTGMRVGTTKQIPVWKFSLDALTEFSSKKHAENGTGSESTTGTVLSSGNIPLLHENSPESGTRNHQVTPIESPPVAGGEITELVNAAVWVAKTSGSLRNEIGFRRVVTKRIAASGASAEDRDALTRFRNCNGNLAASASHAPAQLPNVTKSNPEKVALGLAAAKAALGMTATKTALTK